MISFNALLDACTRFDAMQWNKRGWTMRAAHHADQKVFGKFMKDSWGHADPTPAKTKGVGDLIRDFGRGF